MVGAVGEAELGGSARGGLSLGGFLGEGLCVCVRVWRWRDPTDSETDKTADELQQGTVGMYLSWR